MTSQIPDFKKSHFPYPELERIHGQPTIHQIVLRVYKQLKQNASSVPTTLRGGQHGYLPLVLTNEQWNNIPTVEEFRRPVNPGPFAPRAGRATNAEVAIDKARWEHRVTDYNTCQHLEATLRNQLASAFDYEILDGLRDRITNTLHTSIPNIIKYLFKEYGELSPDELFQKEDEVKAFVYDASQPVSIVFNEIMTLRDLFELTGSVLNESTMIRIGYTILNRARVFRDSLMAWNNKRLAEHTWINFQTHFRKAYRDLKKVNALQLQDSTISHAAILDELKHHQDQSLIQLTDALKQSVAQSLNNITTDDSSDPYLHANATTSSLRQEIAELRKMIQDLTTQQTQNKPPSKRPKQPRQYCWTHGWCAHNGTQCQAKAMGHQPTATLENRLGGSEKKIPK